MNKYEKPSCWNEPALASPLRSVTVTGWEQHEKHSAKVKVNPEGQRPGAAQASLLPATGELNGNFIVIMTVKFLYNLKEP